MVDPTIASKKTGIGGHVLVQLSSRSSTPAIRQNVKTTPADSSELPLPAIIGGAVGGLVMIILVVVLVIYIWYRRKYPVRMVLGKDFQKFSNPAYNTKRMSALQLTSEDPLASYDEPLEQINEGFEIDREDRDSIFDDMPDGPRYLSHEPSRESKENDEISHQITENHTNRQDSQESSTESERKNKKAILITSEQPESFVITNELGQNMDEDENVIQEYENGTSVKSEDSSESTLSNSVINEVELNRKCLSSYRTVGSIPDEVTVNEYETRADNISVPNQRFEINITNDLNENREIFLDNNLVNKTDDKDLNDEGITEVNDGIVENAKVQSDTHISSGTDNTSVDNSNVTPTAEIEVITGVNDENVEYAKVQSDTSISSETATTSVDNSNDTPKAEIESINEVNDVNVEYTKVQSDTTITSETANTSVDNRDDTPKAEIIQDRMFEASRLPSDEDRGLLSDSFFVLGSSETFILEDQLELVKETSRKLSDEYETPKENDLEMSMLTRIDSSDKGGRSDNTLGDGVPRTASDTFETTVSKKITGFNEIGFSPITNSTVDNIDKDDDQIGISIDQTVNQSKEVDLEVLKLGYDLIKQSGINTSGSSEEKLSPLLSPENLVLERPPPTPTVIFDSIILEPDIFSFENKFHSVPDVRVQRPFTMDDDAQPERQRARTSLDSSLNASLSDSFQSLISQTNREEKSEATSTNINQPLSGFEEFATSSIESLTEDSKTGSNESNTTKEISLDSSKTTSSISYGHRIGENLNHIFPLNPYAEDNVNDTEFNLVIVDDPQSDRDVNNDSEKDVQSELTTSSESSSAKSWELIEETSSSLNDFNDKTEGNMDENTGTKLLKIEPTSFDFDNDSSEESKDYDEDSLEVINEDESNA